MNLNIIDFIISKTKIFSIVSIFVFTVTIIFFGFNMGLYYYCGFFVGLINFILLSMGSNMIIDAASIGKSGGKFSQILFFGARYFIIAATLILCIKYLNANVFALVLGLLTIHIALVIEAITKHFEKRKEG